MSRAGWRTVGEQYVYFRSSWEYIYALHLEKMKNKGLVKEWEHEPKTFWFPGIKRGCVTYLPDFKVTRASGGHHWVEVKGWMDAKSKTKIKRFKKYFPNEVLVIIDKTWFKGVKAAKRRRPCLTRKKSTRKIR